MANENKKLCELMKFYAGLKVWSQNTACKARILEGGKKKEAMFVYRTYLHCVITAVPKKILYKDRDTHNSPCKGGYACTIP